MAKSYWYAHINIMPMPSEDLCNISQNKTHQIIFDQKKQKQMPSFYERRISNFVRGAGRLLESEWTDSAANIGNPFEGSSFRLCLACLHSTTAVVITIAQAMAHKKYSTPGDQSRSISCQKTAARRRKPGSRHVRQVRTLWRKRKKVRFRSAQDQRSSIPMNIENGNFLRGYLFLL